MPRYDAGVLSVWKDGTLSKGVEGITGDSYVLKFRD